MHVRDGVACPCCEGTLRLAPKPAQIIPKGLFTASALAWAVWGFAGRTMAEGEVSSRLHWPIGVFIYLMAALLACACAMHVFRTCGAVPAGSASPEVTP